MRPVVTSSEMSAIDAEAPEPVEELIARAGFATARAALDLLDRAYGARIAVLAGKGNNGADGRSAVAHLRRSGAHCTVFEIGPTSTPDGSVWRRAGRPEPFDLIIDACYGTGLGRDFDIAELPIELGRVPILSVDIPSGIDGMTGQVRGTAIEATATVTFAAPKPGLLLWPGRRHVGRLTVADIGLDCSRGTITHLDAGDLDGWPTPDGDTHKWRRAVLVVGGGPGMTGAPALTCRGALRAGAGYVAVTVPGTDPGEGGQAEPAVPNGPIEAVAYRAGLDWSDELLDRADRFGATVVGPGLAETDANRRAVSRWWGALDRPSVFDAGALAALSTNPARPEPGALHILTPHDGEFARLAGQLVGDDRIDAVRRLARRLGAVVLLKGATTVVAEPGGRVLLSTAGDARLATAGTGDVLAGVIAAGLACGLEPFMAAGLGAELHGRAARLGQPIGLLASDLPELVANELADRSAVGPVPRPGSGVWS